MGPRTPLDANTHAQSCVQHTKPDGCTQDTALFMTAICVSRDVLPDQVLPGSDHGLKRGWYDTGINTIRFDIPIRFFTGSSVGSQKTLAAVSFHLFPHELSPTGVQRFYSQSFYAVADLATVGENMLERTLRKVWRISFRSIPHRRTLSVCVTPSQWSLEKHRHLNSLDDRGPN